MKSFYECSPHAISMFGAGILVMMILSLFLAVSAVRLRQKKRIQLICLALTAVLVTLSQGAGEVAFLMKRGREPGMLAAVVGGWNVSAVEAILLLLLGVQIWLLTRLIRTKRSSLTLDSIKESFDTLPDGVCFSDSDGMPLLINRKMQQLSFELFRSAALNVKTCWDRLLKGDLQPEAAVIKADATVMVKTESGVWDFRRTQHGDIIETVAYDVTEEYRLHDELKQQQEKLSETNERLWAFHQNIREYAKERELLEAKTRIHNEVGQLRLALRLALERPADSEKEEMLSKMWQRTVSLLKNEILEQKPDDSMENLYLAAEAVGVRLILTGELPGRGKNQDLLLKAMFECITNTAEHALGDETRAVIREEENRICCVITNNGEPPRSVIRETGGLSNLRSAVEMAGGQMKVESFPVFRVVLEIPKGDQII